MMKRLSTFLALMMTLLVGSITWAHGGMEHILGSVKTMDATSITVETADKHQSRILVDEKTTFEKSGLAASFKDLTIGARVVIHAVEKDEVLTAEIVKFGAPASSAKPGAKTEEDAHHSSDH